jgi:diguanylate cyclase (GGDEF)-like protein/hemerythrin-like metal-binding protein/PAS domain S-box-containing protein
MINEIEMFPWNTNFDTGIAIIDEQHKKLVSLLNKLANHLAYRSDRPTLNIVFNELADYAAYHFQTEENLWHQFFYGNEQELKHKTIHNSFMAEVLSLKAEEKTLPFEQVIEDILSFLTHWLVFHILDNDKRMAKVVHAMQAGVSLEQAIEEGKQEMDEVMKLLIESILSMYDNLSSRTLQLAREIAKRHKAESKQRLAASVFENTLDAICITDTHANIIDANPAFYQTSQYPCQEVLGKNLKSLKSGLDDAPLSAAIWLILDQQGHWSGKVSSRNKNGELNAEWLTLSAVKDAQGEISNYVGVFSNISYFIQQQHNLEHIAHHDILTDLPNRLLLYDRLELAIAHAQHIGHVLAVCYLDLDGFKPINDNFGHVAGDLVLQQVAQRLLKTVRTEDTVARVGGDEFVILFGNLKKIVDCQPLLDRVLQEISLPIHLDTTVANISASIGVTLFPQDNSESEQLLHHADQAMYQAKRLGKSRYCFYQNTGGNE